MDRIIQIIKESFDIDEDIFHNTPLISSGLIDSLKVALLLTILEREYGKKIDTRDIGTDNFDTPAQIAKFLSKI